MKAVERKVVEAIEDFALRNPDYNYDRIVVIMQPSLFKEWSLFTHGCHRFLHQFGWECEVKQADSVWLSKVKEIVIAKFQKPKLPTQLFYANENMSYIFENISSGGCAPRVKFKDKAGKWRKGCPIRVDSKEGEPFTYSIIAQQYHYGIPETDMKLL